MAFAGRRSGHGWGCAFVAPPRGCRCLCRTGWAATRCSTESGTRHAIRTPSRRGSGATVTIAGTVSSKAATRTNSLTRTGTSSSTRTSGRGWWSRLTTTTCLAGAKAAIPARASTRAGTCSWTRTCSQPVSTRCSTICAAAAPRAVFPGSRRTPNPGRSRPSPARSWQTPLRLRRRPPGSPWSPHRDSSRARPYPAADALSSPVPV